MPKDENQNSDIEISPRRKRYANRKRLTDTGISLDPHSKNVRVAIYVRVSKEEQVEGHSLDAQRNVCVEFAKKREWRVVEVYEDPGYSAKNNKRPAFQRMMKDADNGLFDVVLVHKLDRFSRSISDTLASFKSMDERKVAFTSATENFDFSTAQGRLFFNMMAIFAQWYLENLSAESVKGKKELFNKGLHNGAPPFGYIKNKETRKIEVVPDEAEAVRMAFELAAAGAHTHRMIADILDRNFKTHRGRHWSKDTVANMLRNEFYYGMVSFREKIRPGIHEPIITKELFDKAQLVTRDRSTGKRRHVTPQHNKKGNPTVGTKYYMLQKIIRCDACERHLRIQSSPTHKYYKEVSAERGLECSLAAKSVSMKKMDQNVVELLGALRLPPDWQEWISRRIRERDINHSLRQKREKIQDSIRRLDDVYANGRYTRAEYMDQRQKLLDEVNQIVVPDGPSSIERGLLLESLGEYLKDATGTELADICRNIFDAIYTDFVGSRITRFRPANEFWDVFHAAAQLSNWKETDDGQFILQND
jgi:DNA invertase Pin-like site-specific DNA recombinase